MAAPDGSIWYAASAAAGLGRVDPATGAIVEYALPEARGGPHLLAWHDGAIWFGLREGGGYGRFDTRTGQSQVYYLESDRPYSLAEAGGRIWMSSFGAFRLLEVEPSEGAVRVHNLAKIPVSTLEGAVEGPDPRRRWQGEARRLVGAGDAIWFSDFVRSRVVRYDPAAGVMTSYESLEEGTEPYGIARSSSGIVWYGERGANRITVLDPRTGERLRAPIPTAGSYARHVLVDEARGRVWFTLSDIGRLGLIEYR